MEMNQINANNQTTDQSTNQLAAKRKPVIAIFCREMVMGGDPFASDYYWQAYQDLLLSLKQHGAEAYFVTDNNSYRGYGTFDTAYTTDHKVALNELTPVKNVTVDLVFDRGGFIGRDVLTVNPAILLRNGNNKIEMYRHFANLQPYSIVCDSYEEVAAAFKVIDGETIVVKEPEGCGGKEVYIGGKDKVLQQLPSNYPVLVQEFLDTSAGVPGGMTGVHDVRLGICGGEFISYYIRAAKEGSYHSNVSQGGTMSFLDVDEIPEELALAALEVDSHFQNLPRYYAVDFIYTPKGWKMLEINPYLALLPLDDGDEARKTCERLAEYLVAVANNK
jgi:hypothetical protein